jgi:uncharacterized repeat protein (TIGR02543 family)
VTATPNAGYVFVNWTEGGSAVSTSASYNFTVSANRTLVANFIPITYSITTSAAPAAAGTTGGGGTFNSGSTATVTATPNAGYVFVNWTEGGSAVSTSASYNFTVSANRTLIANFTALVPAMPVWSVFVLGAALLSVAARKLRFAQSFTGKP